MKLDAKDRKILYELDKNARIMYTELAKKTGVSKEVARYRHLALEKKGFIEKYFTIIDVARIGFTNYKSFLKLQNANERQEKQLMNWLSSNSNVAWLAACDGAYDIAFGMLAANIEEYSEQLADLDQQFGQLFLQRDIAPIVRGQYFCRDYLVGKTAGTEREMAFGAVPTKPNLDAADGRILKLLGKNGRAPISEMAQTTGLSADAVSKRLRRLEKNGIIRNYILVLNNQKMGQLHYKVLVRLRSVNMERRAALVEFCRAHPNIFYTVSQTFGPWEFEFDLEVPNVESFRSVMRNFKEKFAPIIKDYSYIQIYKVQKYNFCPRTPVVANK